MNVPHVAISRYDTLFIISVTIYVLFFSWYSILKLNTFQMNHDLGIFTQTLWSTIHEGRFFYNSIENYINNGALSHFGVHSSPILAILLPVYALLPAVHTLLISQSLLLGLGALPIYITAKKIIDQPGALVLSLVYFLYPGLHGVNLADFHEIAFFPLLFGFFLYACIVKKKYQIIIFGLLCMMIKEDAAVIVLCASLYGIWITRTRTTDTYPAYLILSIISVLWILVSFMIIMPAFTPDQERVATSFIAQYYQTSGISHPDVLPRILYIIQILVPLLFLPLLSPEIMILSIPPFVEIFLSQSGFYNISAQYSALLIPLLFFATIFSLQKIKKRQPGNGSNFYQILLFILLICGAGSCSLYSPAVQINAILDAPETLHADTGWFSQGISLIPAGASVSTQANLIPFFSERPVVYENTINNTDYIAFLTKFVNSQDYVNRIQEISSSYRCIYKENGFYIFKRNTL